MNHSVHDAAIFPSNTWYVCATSEEVADKPLGRRIANRNMVLFRDAEGHVVGLEDYCPHRGLPLSMGRLDAGEIVCGYHGLRMGSQGTVVSMPGQDVRRFPCVHAYPVVERYGFVWVWPGEADIANPSDIPRLQWADDPAWAYGGGVYHIACDYRLMIDNLMDLTHETYVHVDSIGQSEIDETSVETEIIGSRVETRRYIQDVAPPPFWQMALRESGMDSSAAVDRWQMCNFSLPSHIMIDVGVALTGCGGKEAESTKKTSAIVVDFITPESENTLWYFWGMARNFMADSSELTEQIRESQGRIFAEDIVVLERQQRNLDEFPDRRLLTLNIDAGGKNARRLILEMIGAEKRNA